MWETSRRMQDGLDAVRKGRIFLDWAEISLRTTHEEMELIAQEANELLIFLRRDRLSVDNKSCHLSTSVDENHNYYNYFGSLTNFIVLQAQARCN